MAGIELVEYLQEPGSLPPSHNSAVAEPDMSLYQAAAEGREDVVQQWLEVDRSLLNAPDTRGSTAFHYAADNYHLSVMKVLVNSGADPAQATNSYKRLTALNLAAWYSHKPGEQEAQAIKECMKYLVEELRLDVNQVDNDKCCPLRDACTCGNRAAVEVLLNQENIRLDLVDWEERSVVHASCHNDNVELLQLILEKLEEKGKLFDVLPLKDDKGHTALDLTLVNRHLRMANKLLQFARNDVYTDIDPQLVLDYSQGKETDAIVEFFNTCDPKCLSRQGDGATILHQLAERSWVRAAREVAVKEPSLLNDKDNNGHTPLHYAAARNMWDVVELLMDQKITEIDAVDKDGCTPLLVAARQGCTEAFVKLLERAVLSRTNNTGKNGVFLAAEANHSAILEAIRTRDPSTFRHVDRADATPLHAAAEHGSEKSLMILLDQLVDVNARNSAKLTPLHLAAKNGHNRIVESLLAYVPPSDGDAGQTAVDVSARDQFGDTALHKAALGGHSSVAVTLLSSGASFRARGYYSNVPLHLAAAGGHQELVELLISKYGAEVDARDRDQWTPLHYAAKAGHTYVVTTLLHHKADLTAVDKFGRNALDISIEGRQVDVAMVIIKHDDWRGAMCHSFRLDCGMGPQTTPMRTLITDMPEVALEILNKCTELEDYGKGPRYTDYKVTFDCELLEDLGEPELTKTDANRSPEVNNNTSISWHESGWSCRPSHLVNRLVQRILLPERKGQFTTWGPTVFNKATHPLQLMVKYNRTKLLDHPLVSALLAYKWKRVWPLYVANILFHLVFLCFLTAYALVVPNPQSELCRAVSSNTFANASVNCDNGSSATAYQCGECSSNQPFLYAAGAIVLLCVLLRLINELVQFLEQPGPFFLNHKTWLELFLYSITVIFMSSLGSVCVCPKAWQWHIGALAVFLAWIHLSIFVREMPQLGLYIIMFEDIALTFIKVSISALLLVLAFSMAFYMLFFVPSPLFAASPFATPGLSIIKVMTMGVGEMEFESIFRFISGGVGDVDEVPTPIPYPAVSILLWILFLILMPILLMNLLTGLAVGDVDRIQYEAEYRKIKLQIELILKTEETFQPFRTWFLPQHKYGINKIIIKPNKHCQRKRFLSLLAGVDKNPTVEDISKSLLMSSKHTKVDDVYEHTTALLLKVAELEKAAKLNTGQKTDRANLKAGMEEWKVELSAEQRVEMAALRTEVMGDIKTVMAEQATELGDLKEVMAEHRAENFKLRTKMGDLKAAVSGMQIEMGDLKTEIAEQKSEVNDLKREMLEHFQRMEALLLRGLAGQEGTGGAGLVGEEGHSSATTQ